MRGDTSRHAEIRIHAGGIPLIQKIDIARAKLQFRARSRSNGWSACNGLRKTLRLRASGTLSYGSTLWGSRSLELPWADQKRSFGVGRENLAKLLVSRIGKLREHRDKLRSQRPFLGRGFEKHGGPCGIDIARDFMEIGDEIFEVPLRSRLPIFSKGSPPSIRDKRRADISARPASSLSKRRRSRPRLS